MASGKIPGVRTIPYKQVGELSKLPWTRDEELSTDKHEARLLPDGRVLLVMPPGGSGTLYPSREPLVKWQRESAAELAKARNGPYPAQELLPPIDDFLRDVEAHAKSLGPRLRIPDEVLDGTPESLDAVDKALKRIPWAKRQVPDLVTPLVAYLGEVMRKGCGGQWTKIPPTTREREVSVYDPVELAAYNAHRQRVIQAANAAGQKAMAEGRSFLEAHGEAYKEMWTLGLVPIRTEVIVETIDRDANVPLITTRGGQVFHPFACVYLPMVEPSRRGPLRSSIGVPYDRPGAKPKPLA